MLHEYLKTRDNNLTAVRLILAWFVLLGHAYSINKIPGLVDPLSAALKSTWIGAVAVELFFALSGMLVAKSFADRGPVKYLISRILRIYPALIVCVTGSIFVLGPILSELNFGDYITDDQTYAYLGNATLISRIEWFLPGIALNGSPVAMNGSLWTLPVEARCYALLFILGACGILSNRLMTGLMVILLLSVSLLDRELLVFFGHNERWLRPAAYFLIGVLAWQWSDHIPLTLPFAALSLFILFSLNGHALWHVLGAIPLVYLALSIAYLTPNIHMDKWLGDISYGIYIYAWPIQIFCALKLGTDHPVENWLFATPITFLIAYLSWRFVESPALKLKRPLMQAWDRSASKYLVFMRGSRDAD